MKIRIALILPAVLILIVLIGLACSGGKISPLTPDAEGVVTPDEQTPDAAVAGLWQIVLDPATGEASVMESRQAEKALNALGLLEQQDLLGITIDTSSLIIDPLTGYVRVDITLNHPGFSQTGQFSIFDVKGIVFGPKLDNADGYTPLLRPSDFKGVPFGYIDGKLGTPERYVGYNDTDYPYKYFADGLKKTDILPNFFSDPVQLMQRGIFTEGSSNTRRYELYFDQEPGDKLVFNYAVLVNYDFPVGIAPYTLGDFPIWTANEAEPFHVYAKLIHNGLYSDPDYGIGGTVSVDAEVYDWQGLDDIVVIFEVPGVTQAFTTAEYTPGSTIKSGIFSFRDIPGFPQQSGTFVATITAYDTSRTFGQSFFLNLLPPDHPLYDLPAYTQARLELTVVDGAVHIVSPIAGDSVVGVDEVHEYTAKVVSPINPFGPFVYEWEKGTQLLPQYDDGDGGNDSTIDFSWDKPGAYTVDCRVTDPSTAVATSIAPLLVHVVVKPASVGDLTLVVNRRADGSILRDLNVTLSWNSVNLAKEYAIYIDQTPMNGVIDAGELAGTAIGTVFNYTMEIDAAVYFEVRARAISGEADSEGPASDGAFVDFEQAEYIGAQGSWNGNSFYDNLKLSTTRSNNYAHHLAGGFGWYNMVGSSAAYHDSYEIFYSQAYPELANADTFLFEVAHRVFDYSDATDNEDGYAMGILAESNPTPGGSAGTCNTFVVQSPILGDLIIPMNDALTDEFTYSGNPDAGYTGTYSWRLSTFNVDALQSALFDRVAIGHATDALTQSGAFVAFDEIAVIIH